MLFSIYCHTVSMQAVCHHVLIWHLYTLHYTTLHYTTLHYDPKWDKDSFPSLHQFTHWFCSWVGCFPSWHQATRVDWSIVNKIFLLKKATKPKWPTLHYTPTHEWAQTIACNQLYFSVCFKPVFYWRCFDESWFQGIWNSAMEFNITSIHDLHIC